MALRRTSRLIGLTVFTGAFVLAQQGHAMADVDGNPNGRVEDRFEHISDDTSCVGANALKSVTYSVDGVVVPDLIGVSSDSDVTASFELNEGCHDTKLGMAVYATPSDHYVDSEASQQRLVDQQTGVFDSGSEYSLTVSTIPCYFQLDFFTGDVLNTLSPTANYSTPINNLIGSANGGSKACDVEPVEVTTTTTVVGHQHIDETVQSTTSTTVEDTPYAESGTQDSVEVAAISITRDPQVATEELATTGSNTSELAIVGTVLILLGLAMTALVKVRRQGRK
jgi:hypothetical protein